MARSLSPFFISIGPVEKGHGVVGIQSDHLGVIGNGSVVVTFFRIGIAPVVKGHNVVGIQPDGLAVIRQGPVVLAFFRIIEAPVVKGPSVVGIQSDRLGVIGNRSLDVAFSRISKAPVDNGNGVLGIESHRFAGGRDSLVIVTVADVCVALVHQGRVARSCLCFSVFASLLLRPLSLGFLTLALRFRLGRGLRLLLLCRGSEALLFSLLSLSPCIRLGRGLRLLLLCRGSEALLFSLLSRVWLHCPWQRYWRACCQQTNPADEQQGYHHYSSRRSPSANPDGLVTKRFSDPLN